MVGEVDKMKPIIMKSTGDRGLSELEVWDADRRSVERMCS